MVYRLGLVLVLLLVTLGPVTEPVDGVGVPLYPDLRTLPPADLYFDRVRFADGLLHYVLRFSSTVWNAGEGRLELEGDPNPTGANKKVYQNVYDAPVGGTRVSRLEVNSDLLYHPSHYHFHFRDFASYLLLKTDENGVLQSTRRTGSKTSFCVMDNRRVTATGPASAQFVVCDATRQGLSVGWGDTYQASLPDQWIDLGTSPLADGYYAVRATADPLNKLNEAGRDGNNAGTTYFTVRGGRIITTAECGLAPTSGRVGSPTTMTCSNFAPGEAVRIYWDTTTSTPLGSFTASATGAGSLTINVPSAKKGNHSVIAVGATSGKRATATFTVQPSLRVSPTTVTVGTTVTVVLGGYAPRETVTIRWYHTSTRTTTLMTVTTSMKGSGAWTFVVPWTTYGSHRVEGVGSAGSRAAATAVVQASIRHAPSRGVVDKSVVVDARGFGASEEIWVTWDSPSGAVLGKAVTGSTGSGRVVFAIPNATNGPHRFYVVGKTTGARAESSLGVLAGLAVNPTGGATGQTVGVTGTGYGAGEAVHVFWDSETVAVATATADPNGRFTTSFTVPNGAAVGAHRVSGVGATSGTASATFTVTTAASAALAVAATPTPTATATPQPTATAAPTATFTPEPTATATLEPTPTSTPEPTAAPPEPTPTEPPPAPPTVEGVDLLAADQAGVTLQVRTVGADRVVVEYGIDGTYGQQAEMTPGNAGIYQVTVGDLEPGTTYHYRIVATGPGGQTVTDDATFATAP